MSATIPEVLGDNVRCWADRTALATTRRGQEVELSFRDLEQASSAFATKLHNQGIRKGDGVLIFVPMSLELYVVLLGVFRVGAVAMFVDPSAGVSFIERCCRQHVPAAIVAGPLVRVLRHFVGSLRSVRVVVEPRWERELTTVPPAIDVDSSDGALMTFTSGSTGEAKAAIRSHGFLLAQHAALRKAISLEPGERDLTTLPIFVLANLASGLTSIIPEGGVRRPGAICARRVAAQARRLRARRVCGSPAFLERMLSVPGSLAQFEKIFTGGAPVFPRLMRRLLEAAPEAVVVAVYGSTEAEPVAELNCRQVSAGDWAAMGSGMGLLAGAVVRETELRVVADKWGSTDVTVEELPTGSVGEIIVTGDHVLRGYVGGRGDSETKIHENDRVWHRTGDAGYRDADGRLWLVGRCSAKIVDHHGCLYPFGVECQAMENPDAKRVALVAHRGKRVLVVEWTRRVSKRDIEMLQTSLEWARIDRIESIRKMPVDRRHNSKIDYRALARALD